MPYLSFLTKYQVRREDFSPPVLLEIVVALPLYSSKRLPLVQDGSDTMKTSEKIVKIIMQNICSCFSVHPCENKNGGCEQKCVKRGDSAACKCRKGFKLAADGKKCDKGLFILVFSSRNIWTQEQDRHKLPKV